MKFYSLIKISTNTATDDSVTVGVLCFDGDKLHSYISNYQRKLANKLLGDSSIDIDFLLSQITKKIETINEDVPSLLSNSKEKYQQPSLYSYLNTYSMGILQFSEPKILDIQIVDVNALFNYLFKKDFSSSSDGPSQAISEFPKEIVEQKLLSKVRDQIHTEYKFKKDKFPSIHFNYELDCIGKNGSLIGAKSFDFNRSYQTVDTDISHYFALIASLSNKFGSASEKNYFYLLAEEPNSTLPKTIEAVYRAVKTNPLIEIISPEKSEIIADKVKKSGATVFLD